MAGIKLRVLPQLPGEPGPAGPVGPAGPIGPAGPAGTGDMLLAGHQTTTGGFRFTPFNLSLTGTVTPDAMNGNYQFGTNNAAFTLNAPVNGSAIDLVITNGATAGAITFNGFRGGNHGDPLTTINGDAFLMSMRNIAGACMYSITALQ